MAGLFFSIGIPSFSHVSVSGGEKYEDARVVLTELAVLLEGFVVSMNEAEKPDDIARVLYKFTEAIEGMLPDIDEIRKKYPELNDEETHPEELKPLVQRIDKDFQAMMKAYVKVNANLEDPVVKEADTKFKEVMASLG